MGLHEYDGATLHAGERGRRHSTRECCSDHSGSIEYAFNSLGYRGAEPDSEAEVLVYAVGCSHAFGVGVAEELTWPSVFCRGFAGHYGVPAGRLSLLNLSQGAAANDYIARVVLTQCARVEPSLVVAAFTHRNRVEHVAERSICNVGPWRVKDPQDRIGTPSGEIADAFYDYYSDEVGAINAVKNILLVQEFLKARRIPYLFSWIGEGPEPGARHPVIRRLLELVDGAHLCPASIEDPDVFVDKAADRAHPGPRSHARFAGRMLATCRALYPTARFRPPTIIEREPDSSSGRAQAVSGLPSPPAGAGNGDAREMAAGRRRRRSRWRRLREKMRRIRKDDPNVYPLY